MSVKGQGNSLTLVKGPSDFKVKTCLSQKQLDHLAPTLIWKLKREWEWKIIQMSWVTWPTWPPCPYMVKNLKSLLLQKQYADDLENWYVALSMQVLPRLFKIWPWVDLDLFYVKVKFGHGKKWKLFFFGNYCSLGSQSYLKHSAKWVNKVEWVSKVKIILWPWSKVPQISKLNVWLWPVYSGERFRAMGPLV